MPNQRNRRSRSSRGPRTNQNQQNRRPNRPSRTDSGLPQVEDIDALSQEQLVAKAKDAGITGAARFGRPG